MANSYLVCGSNGSVASAGTYQVCDTTSTSDSEAANTALTTSYVTSSTFTPGAISIDGILVKLASVAASPTGTMSIALDQGGSTVANTEIIVNVSDLPSCSAASNEGGWFLVKFGVTVTLAGATAYSVKGKTSSASQVNLYSSATTNWSRLLRTTTTQAPGTTDSVIIVGEWTAAATMTSRTATMDRVSNSNLLGTNNASGAVNIGKGGTLQYSTSASTNYYLRLGTGTIVADLIVYNGGTLNIGTSGTKVPITSTAVLEFNITAGQADNKTGVFVRNGGTWNAYGIGAGSNPIAAWSMLTADVAAAGTVLHPADTTGWSNGDVVCITSTTRTTTDCESKTTSTIDSSTQVTLTAGVTVAHSGTGRTAGEVGNITRNVKVRSTQSTMASTGGMYAVVRDTAQVSLSHVEMSAFSGFAVGTRGVAIFTDTSAGGSCTIDRCTFHDCRNGGYFLEGLATGSTVQLTRLVLYNMAAVTANGVAVQVAQPTSGVPVLDTILVCLCGNTGLSASAVGFTLRNFTLAGAQGSFAITASQSGNGNVLGSWYGVTVHSSVGGLTIGGINASSVVGTPAAPMKVWRNSSTSSGLAISGVAKTDLITIESPLCFGNGAANLTLTVGQFLIRNATLDGDASFSVTTNMLASSGVFVFQNLSCSPTVAATTDITAPGSGMSHCYVYGGSLAGTTAVTGQTSGVPTSISFVRLHNVTVGGVAGCYRAYCRNGTIFNEGTQLNTGGGTRSWKMTPNSATVKLLFPDPLFPGVMQTYLAAYTGANPASIAVPIYNDGSGGSGGAVRLVIPGGYADGVGAVGTDLVATTTTTGAWTTLTISNIQPTSDCVIFWFVDCDTTCGANVYVDGPVVVTQ